MKKVFILIAGLIVVMIIFFVFAILMPTLARGEENSKNVIENVEQSIPRFKIESHIETDFGVNYIKIYIVEDTQESKKYLVFKGVDCMEILPLSGAEK